MIDSSLIFLCIHVSEDVVIFHDTINLDYLVIYLNL